MRWLVLPLLAASLSWGQAPSQSPPAAAATQNSAQGTGPAMDSEWDLRKLLDSVNNEARRLKPILDQADPKNWDDRSAAQNYAPQWKGAQNEIQYLATTANSFGKEPERLTLALETFFRLESLERSPGSYATGMKKYGNPAVAELLEGTVRENSDNREHLRQYISELAQTKEQEFKIADQEAQRCRNTLSKQPPQRSTAPAPAAKKK